MVVSYAYIAGFLDGEGSISVLKTMDSIHSRPQRGRERRVRLITKLCLGANTNRGVLELIRERFGTGRIETRPQIGNQKASYRLDITNRKDTMHILKRLKPHLIIKKRHAELIMEFIKSRDSRRQLIEQDPETGKIVRNLGKSYTQREIEIYENLRELNKKGVESIRAW